MPQPARAASIVGGASGAAHVSFEAEPAGPLAQAVFDALASDGVWAGGTTPRHARLTGDNALGTLVVGTPNIVHAMCDAIAVAEHEVLLQVYQWHDTDEATALVSAALQARLARARAESTPFRVAIVLGNAWWAEHKLKVTRLRAALGADDRDDARHVRVELRTYGGSVLDILHSKTTIIDGTFALVSTANLYTHGGLTQDSFNVAAHVQGPLVAGLMQDFHHARHHAHNVVQRHGASVAYLPCEDAPWRVGAVKQAMLAPRAPLPMFALAKPDLQAALLSRPATWGYHFGGDQNPQARGLIALIDHAKRSIRAINPALNVPAYKQALLHAIVERGVRVELVMSYFMNKTRQHYLFGGDNADTVLELYTTLLARGGPAAADRLQVHWGADASGDIAPARHPGNIHAKIASFDGDALLVGSTNWDWPSYNSARELSVVLLGIGVGRDFERDVFAPLVARSRPVQADDLPAHAQWRGAPAFDYLQP